jgi:hypothetical protein
MSEESIDRLRCLGYSREEASFLYLTAAHSGYFVRRQFTDLLGIQSGGTAARFIERLLHFRDGTVVHYRRDRHVYRLKSMRIYSRVGDRDSANRNAHAPITIKRKLMTLDFVIAHRGQYLLNTASDKIEYFSQMRGVPEGDLPARHYVSRGASKPIVRHFVDKLPIYVSAGKAYSTNGEANLPMPAFPDAVHLGYIDEGAESLDGFETFLRQYHPLFMHLGNFEVVYVTAESRWVETAEKVFRQFYPTDGTTTLGEIDPDQARMLDFFEVRRKRENKEFKGLTTERLLQYRIEKGEFGGAEFEQLYQAWLSGGMSALRLRSLGRSLNSGFRAVVLPHDYELFGRLQRAS